MNVFDYFFEHSKSLRKNFILNKNKELSYADLFNNSLKVANFLKNKLGQGKCVVLISHNSNFFISAYLGILKSGNVCVPLNFNIEQRNLDHIISLTESSVVFAAKQIVKKLNFSDDIDLLDEDRFDSLMTTEAATDFNVEMTEDQLAEIIFTSGSTGEPKGVMISHKNIRANTESIVDYLELNSEDIICSVLPFYYCYGLSLLHTHLRVGGAMVLNNTFMFLGTVIKDLLTYECTGFSGVPSHFQLLLKKSDSFKTTHFEHLRYVTQAGGKLPSVFIEEFTQAFPEIQFYVMYGQTEATARLAYLSPERLQDKLGSIGKAIPGVQLKLVSEQGEEVGVDEQGELMASGKNIMLGYYKDEALTEEVLDSGWLYTGDVGVKDDEGYIYIVARKKEFIKVGGNRISPKEIEGVISSVSNVIDASVIGINDEIQGEAIKAIVVINDLEKEEQIKTEILLKCKNKLALYKIPQFFEFTDKFNLKSTGKK